MAPIERRAQRLLAVERGAAAAAPAVGSGRPSRSAICASERTRTRAAASSIASGMPSSRRQICGDGGGVRRRSARSSAPAAWARSTNSATASDVERRRVGRVGGASERGAPRDLAGDVQRLAAGGEDAQARAAGEQRVRQLGGSASTRCSQLSSTSSSLAPPIAPASASIGSAHPPAARRPARRRPRRAAARRRQAEQARRAAPRPARARRPRAQAASCRCRPGR